MELSEPQKRLIREICQIQYNTLTEILLSSELGTNSWGEKWEDVLESMDLSREEFDDGITETVKTYQNINNDPNTLFSSLNEFDFKVFEYILELLDDQLLVLYPKAYENLLVKVDLWKDIIENRKQ